MKRHAALLSIFAFSLILASPVFANHDCGGGQCSMKKQCSKDASDCGEAGQCPITAKFMKKAGFFLDNKAEIGLSDAQVGTIKALKHEVEKTGIRQGAEMQIFMLDVMAKLHEEKIDVEGTNALIDKGSAEMSASAKSVVAAYAKLKETLTPDQLAKAKAIWGKKS